MSRPEREDRAYFEPKKSSPDYRNPFERDHDRILYSSAFRRLAEITQVVSAAEGHVFHNRLTHSLRVAQVARRLAQKLITEQPKIAEALELEPELAEAAGLAHDLGHPPFGHIAEETLNELVTEEYKLPDGFEGNAQSFRIVTRLALRAPAPHPDGLNLTRGTLDALLKYPWFRVADNDNKSRKWGAYNSERVAFEFARALHTKGDERKSPEAEIMDWADDVTYAVHDVEDFYRAGLIPLERLALIDDASERERFFTSISERPELLRRIGGKLTDLHQQTFTEAVTGFPLDQKYTGVPEQRSKLRNYVSALIGEYIDALKLQEPENSAQRYVTIGPRRETAVKMLKLLAWHYVIYNPALATQQYGEREMIRNLFTIFHRAATDPKQRFDNIFPFAYRGQLRETGRDHGLVTRLVADLISSLTERQVIELHHPLTGIALGSALDVLR